MAWFSWEESFESVPDEYKNGHIGLLSTRVAAALEELLDQQDGKTLIPWTFLLGQGPAFDVAWTVAVDAGRRGMRVAVLNCPLLFLRPGASERDDEVYEWVEKALTADVCILLDLEELSDLDEASSEIIDNATEDHLTDEALDLLLVRRRRHPGLMLITSISPETEAHRLINKVHQGLVNQVEQYRGLRSIAVPDEPQLPGCIADMGDIVLSLDTDDPHLMGLCRDYWSLNDDRTYRYSVKELADRYGLRMNEVPKTVTEASTAQSNEVACPSCRRGIIVTSRQYLAEQQRRHSLPECVDCQNTRRETKLGNKANQFRMTDSRPIDLTQLTLADAVTLLALLRTRTGEALAHTIPLDRWEEPFAATDGLQRDWVFRLFENGILRINPDSSMSAFEWVENKPEKFFPDQVSYYITGCGEPAERARDAIELLTAAFRDGPWPEAWRNSWPEVWTEIAVAECVAYLKLCLSEHNLRPFSAGEKTIAVFTDTLETFSIGQAYYFIWRAARDAAAYMVREDVLPARAANSAVGGIKKAMERARANGWEITSYKRDRRLPVSELSHAFFTVGMQISDFMAARRREVDTPVIATPRPQVEPDVTNESLPPGAIVGPDGTVYVSPQPSRRVVKISRNAPCPCGSGKKFKRCCGGARANEPI